MSFPRMLAVGGVYLLACGGWAVLGTSTLVRSNTFSAVLGRDVESLYGGPVLQEAPELSAEIPGSEGRRPVLPSSNRIEVALRADYRRRGLVWFPTFVSDFRGTYTVRNPEKVAQKVRLHFRFPDPDATYEDFGFVIDDAPVEKPVDPAAGLREILQIPAGQTRSFSVAYRMRGLGEWRYRPAGAERQVRDLELVMTTGFRRIDYPELSLSPTSPAAPAKDGKGMRIEWKALGLITGQDIGMVVPERLNPGPLSARITFFAPVCLFFFFVLIGAIHVVCRVPIHPMHYLFVAAGFFSFHLLFAYLVDHANMHLSFALAALTAVALVTGYLRGALGTAFPWRVAAAGQVFYLVLFSYSFFLKGTTGLTVTVGAILTLGVLMRVTAKVNWFEFFALCRRAKAKTLDAAGAAGARS